MELNETRKKLIWSLFGGFLVVIFFLFLGWMRMVPALSDPQTTLTLPGDGYGTIGWIADLSRRLRLEGWGIILGDAYVSPNVGGGFLPWMPWNFFWKSLYGVLALFFAPADVYDVVCYLGFVLNALAAFILARTLGLTLVSSLLLSYLVANLPGFETRISGHVTLAFVFFPMLFFAAAIRAGRQISIRRVMIMVSFLWLSLVFNEYTGYFAGFFGAVLFVGYLGNACKWNLKIIWSLSFRPLMWSFILLVILISFSHPAVIFGRVLTRLGLQDLAPTRGFSSGDFSFYSLRNPLVAFSPNIDWIRDFFSTSFFVDSCPEFTFRVGFVMPFIALIGYIILLIRQRSRSSIAVHELHIWMFAILVAISLGLSTDYRWLSLARLTKHIAPMFRVGVRSYWFVDIGVVFVFFIVLDQFLKATVVEPLRVKRRLMGFRWMWIVACGGLLLFGGAFLLAVRDLTGSLQVVRTYVTSRLPSSMVLLEPLRDLPEGMVLELPFFAEALGDTPETDYGYLLHTSVHRKPTLNFMRNSKYTGTISRFAKEVNEPSQRVVGYLRNLGIRYLVVWRTRPALEHYASLKGLRVLNQSEHVILFEIENAQPWDQNRFRDQVLAPSTMTYTADRLMSAVVPVGSRESRVDSEGKALVYYLNSPDVSGFVTYGPYVELVPGRYQVIYRISLLEESGKSPRSVVVEVSLDHVGVVASRTVNASDLGTESRIGEVVLDFEFSGAEVKVTEFRISQRGVGKMLVDSISIQKLP